MLNDKYSFSEPFTCQCSALLRIDRPVNKVPTLITLILCCVPLITCPDTILDILYRAV